jgi:hypothetical protein
MKACIATILLSAALSGGVALAAPIPTPEQFLGYPAGQRFTSWDRIVAYFEMLQSSTPRLTLHRMGETAEGRPLIYAVIASEKNQQQIEAIRGRVLELAHPETTTRAHAQEIAANTPAVIWLAYGVHGNESSPSEAAMLVASRLLSGSPETEAILEKCVIIIDPLQNPDGRERYVEFFRQTRGAIPDPNPDSQEHAEWWPGGRFNHYLIDMNRDWAWLTQKETQARAAAYVQWYPQVFVDFHEMGYESSYFFPPDAQPINNNIGGNIQKWLRIFGEGNAAAFAKRGWPFFVSETFDLFYPAYGDSWPSLHGAIGMTYEVGGSGRGGSEVLREDGTTVTLAGRIDRHFTSSMSTIATAAEHRSDLLLHTYDTLAAHAAGTNTYILLPGSPNLLHAVHTLQRQGIAVSRTRASTKLHVSQLGTETSETIDVPAGSAVVSSHQPLGGLADSILEKTPAITPEFIKQQRQKIDSDETDEFYDITAWSIPIAQSVETVRLRGPAPELEPWSDPPLAHPSGEGAFGFLVDGLDPFVYPAAGHLLAGGFRFSVSDQDLNFGGRTFHRGTLVIQRLNNTAALNGEISELSKLGADVVSAETPWSGDVALGSETIHFIRDPKIALVTGDPVDPTSVGGLWHAFDVEVPIPHSLIPASRLGGMDLTKYRTIILPDGGNYADRMGKQGVERLQAWVRSGGVLIAIKGASAFVRSKDVELSKIKLWPPKKTDEEETPEDRYNDYRIPGAAFRTSINLHSYLTFGLPQAPNVILEGTMALLPVVHKADDVVTIAATDPLVSGFAWPESIQRIKGAAYLVREHVGSGVVITFADEPFFRLFWRGTLPLLMNASLYSATFNQDGD